jgi:hypothetical protein
MAFITYKKQADIELFIKLQKNSVITTLKDLFKRSQQQKINSLIIRGVFEFVQYKPMKYLNIQIFNSRLVNKVKKKAINTLFKKSKLVV